MKDLWETALPSAREYWFKAQQTLPRNIYNYTIRYMNNSLASLSNLSRWGKSLTSSCNFCRQIQTTKHVLSGCTPCLERYTWRHNSILLNIAKILKPLVKTIYVDLPGRFLCPDSITGASHRPDMILIDSENKMYLVELTVGHESNVDRNIKRKADKYSHLLKDQRLLRTHKKVEFMNLVITTGEVFSKDTKPFFTMLNSLQTNIVKYVALRVITVCIRTSYYIFCMREKDWTTPELMEF